MGVIIERSVPMPTGREDTLSVLGEIRLALMAMEPGEHFTAPIDHSRAYRAAKEIGAEIKTVKTKGGRIVWLAKKPTKMTLNPDEVKQLCARFGITRKEPPTPQVVEKASRRKLPPAKKRKFKRVPIQDRIDEATLEQARENLTRPKAHHARPPSWSQFRKKP